MCGCDSQTSVGRNGAGAVAIIHATSEPSGTARQLRLFFSNPTISPIESTQVTLDSEELRDLWSRSNHNSLSLRIHSHGDLTTTPSSSVTSLASEASSISDGAQHVLQFTMTDSKTPTAELNRRLDLGVGGEGVIGKMVSVSCNGLDLGNGVIGWN